MLQQLETRQVRSTFNRLRSGEVIPEEGIALVYIKEDGQTVVQKSTGAAGEIFAGVSSSRNAPPAFLPFVQEQEIPASLTMQLVRTPTPGQAFIAVGGVALTIGAAAPTDATKVQLVGTTLKFFAGEAGKHVKAQFMYTPTVLEARQIIGDTPIGGLSTTPQGEVGTLTDAQIGTNFFDASVDWSAAFFVKTAAGGKFTVGTEDDHVPGVIVKKAPVGDSPFLVLGIKVAN